MKAFPVGFLSGSLISAPVVYLLTSFHLGNSNPILVNIAITWIPTSIIFIFGIPSALFINRLWQEELDTREQLKLRDREKTILYLIKEELGFNQILFDDRKGNLLTLPEQSLQYEVWDTLKYSGDLQKIKSSEVLNYIASTYYIIKQIVFLEEMALQGMLSSKEFADLGPPPKKISGFTVMLYRVRKYDGLFEKSIRNAIYQIDEYTARLTGT